MKEPIVYLPMPHMVKEGGTPVFIAHEVYSALESAGVKWVQETPEEHKIRMMSLQIEELKNVCTKLQGELHEAQAENGSLAGLLADAQKQIDELDDQNEALKMTARMSQEELKAIRLAGHYGKGKP